MNNAVPTSPLLQQMGHPHSYPSLGQISNPYEQQPPGKELNKYASLKAVGESYSLSPLLFRTVFSFPLTGFSSPLTFSSYFSFSFSSTSLSKSVSLCLCFFLHLFLSLCLSSLSLSHILGLSTWGSGCCEAEPLGCFLSDWLESYVATWDRVGE